MVGGLIQKIAGSARVIDQDSDASILAQPSFHLSEFSRVCEVSLKNIDGYPGVPPHAGEPTAIG
jgi:hypothetical protein